MVHSTTIYDPLFNHLWSTLQPSMIHSSTIYGPLYNHLWSTLQPSMVHSTTIDNLLYNHLQKSTKTETFSDATRPTKLKTGRYLCRLYCAIVIFRHTRWKKIAFGGEPLKKGKSYRSFSTFIPAKSFNYVRLSTPTIDKHLLCFASVSKRVPVRSFLQFYSHVNHHNFRANQSNFHMKGFALGVALKQRRKATRKSRGDSTAKKKTNFGIMSVNQCWSAMFESYLPSVNWSTYWINNVSVYKKGIPCGVRIIPLLGYAEVNRYVIFRNDRNLDVFYPLQGNTVRLEDR